MVFTETELKVGQKAIFRHRSGDLFKATITRVGQQTIDLDNITYEYNRQRRDVVLVELIKESSDGNN